MNRFHVSNLLPTSFLCIGSTLIVLSLSPLALVHGQSNSNNDTQSEATTTADALIAPSSIASSNASEGVVSASEVYQIESLPESSRVFNDFVLGPGKVEFEIEPGETKIIELNVSNRYQTEKTFSVEVEDIRGSDKLEQSVVLLGDDRGPYTLKDYLTVPATKFTLGANRRAVVPVTVSIPADAEPGGMYGSVLVKTVTQKSVVGDETTPTRSAIESRIGTLFFVSIPGDIVKEANLKQFSTINDRVWYPEGPIDFQIVYENTGAIHLNPYGELQINNMFGEQVGYQILEPWFILPGSLRSRDISWNRDFLYGRYIATLKLNRGYDNIVDTAEITFWVIPWKIVLVVLFGVLIFFWLLKRFFSSFELKRKE